MVKTKATAAKAKKKPADFKRPKRKVGRRAPQAANVTSVAIASRRLTLLEQSVLAGDKGAAVTHRGLALPELLPQVGHYNAHMRQRALLGLRELTTAHAGSVLANAAVVLERFLPALADEEAVVRDAAVGAWKVLAPALAEGQALKPFAKLVAVYFCSGLTHLQVGVRRDTLRAIGALLDVAPELISVDAGLEQLGRLVENFRDLIAAAQAQGIKVTNSYDALVSKKSASSSTDASGGKARGAPKKTSATKAGALTLRFAALKVLHRLLMSIDFSGANKGDASTRGSALQAARSASIGAARTVLLYPTPVVGASSQSAQLRNVGFWQQKSRSLLQPLLDLWIECLEGEVENLSEEYVEHMQYIIESVTVVLGANTEFMAANPDDELCRVARRLQDQLMLKFPLFPEHNIVNSGDAYLSTWYGINVAIAKFACVFLRLPSKFRSQQLEARIFTFVVSTFAKYEASDELRSLGGTHVIVRSLLEVVALLLAANAAKIHSKEPIATADEVEKARASQEELLECFTALYNKTSSKSVTFRICTAFVLEQLATLKPWPKWELIMQWMTCFGNLLGYLELAHMELGRRCLFAMISVIKQLPAEWAAGEQMQSIMANLVNFYNLAPTAPLAQSSDDDGSKKKQMTQFDALRAEDQMEFVSLIYHLPRYPVELLRALASCCKSERVDFGAKSFLMDILFQRRECLDIAHLVSFLMSSVLARTGNGDVLSHRAHQLHLQLVHHVCSILNSMNLGATLSQILAPALARQVATLDSMQPVDVHTLVLLYRVCISSATSTKGVVALDLPSGMEQHVLTLGAKVMREFVHSQQPVQEDADRALVTDFMDILALCDSIFLPLLRALVGSASERADDLSSGELSKRLRVLQVLVRAAPLSACFVRNQQSVLALVRELETLIRRDGVDTPALNDEVSRLLRQVQGDLELLAVGSAGN